jgi:hypothetical protein
MIDFLKKINDIRIEDFYPIDLNNINFQSTNTGIAKNIDGMPGEEHYRLLCLISTWVDNTVIYELGTYQGASSLCLAYNKTNRVITYDVEYQIEVKTQPNIEYRIGQYQYDKSMLESPIIFIDTTHDGVFERDCYQYLIHNNYKGLTVWDDIHLNDEMKSFWNTVTHPKIDISKFGHWSGTGAIVFQ